MRQRTAFALALLVLATATACGEAPTSPRSDLRAVGASKDVTTADGGGMFGSGHKSGTPTTTDSTTLTTTTSTAGGGMFGSGH